MNVHYPGISTIYVKGHYCSISLQHGQYVRLFHASFSLSPQKVNDTEWVKISLGDLCYIIWTFEAETQELLTKIGGGETLKDMQKILSFMI